MNKDRSNWTSSFAFTMSAIGAAVGLGNIWKFPYMVGNYGGSAFVLVYLICIILVSLPLALAEIVTGKIVQVNPFFCYQKLFSKFSYKQNFLDDLNITKSKLNLVIKKILKFIYRDVSPWLLIITPLMFVSLYSVIGGWILEYFFVHSFSGFVSISEQGNPAETFNNLVATPQRVILMTSLFIIFGSVIVLFGVEKGIGKANNIMVPGLFFILLFLLGSGIYYGNFDAAYKYLFEFNLDAALTWEVFLAAMSQTFFSVSIGCATLMLYGSHLKKDTKNIGKNVVAIILADTFIAILAGLVVFSFLFTTNDISTAAGPSLVFEVLPVIFSKIPLAKIIAPLFCIFLIFASLTSLVSLLEPLIGFLLERYPLVFKNRFSALLLVVAIIITLSSLIILSMAKKLAIDIDLFTLVDFSTSGFLFPLNAMLNALFFGIILSWISKNYLSEQQVNANKLFLLTEFNLSAKLFNIFMLFVKYISPLAILLIFLAGLNII